MASKKPQALLQKLELLAKTFKPIPFLPNKTLDFSTHEQLLKRIGLWDFVHVEFECNIIQTDLLAQLVVTFNPQNRCSYINGNRINVSRADLARALRLPEKKDEINVVQPAQGDEEVVSEEAIAFVEDLVSNWVVLHEDSCILPNEVLNWTRMIKEGHPEKVDWASLMWFMVEKEVSQGSRLGHCFYASHLQCLIKSQHEAVFALEPIVDVKEDEELLAADSPPNLKDEELLAADSPDKFEAHLDKIDIINSKLLDVDKKLKLLKEICSEPKELLAADSPPNE